MRQLPFPDQSLHAVVSHWAVHNFYNADERAIALAEIHRVRKPNGRVTEDGVSFSRFVRQLLPDCGVGPQDNPTSLYQ